MPPPAPLSKRKITASAIWCVFKQTSEQRQSEQYEFRLAMTLYVQPPPPYLLKITNPRTVKPPAMLV